MQQLYSKSHDDVEDDLLTIGIVPTYTQWVRHGGKRHDAVSEDSDSDDESDGDEMREMLDHFKIVNTKNWLGGEQSDNGPEEVNEDSTNFF